MSALNNTRARLAFAAAALLAVGGAAGFGIARLSNHPEATMAAAGPEGRQILYWYDPMVPTQRFDKPGKSPFMDMQLVPKYADEAVGGAGVQIDPARVQNLGVRLATAQRGSLASELTAPGVIDFNQRDLAIVQARAAGFVQRVHARAPGDVIAAGAPLADLLVPEWGGAQGEYLAVRRTGDARLTQAARQRLTLLGMSPGLIAAVEHSGRPQTTITITTPTGGVIRTLGVRAGMSIAKGQTLAEISGLGTVWLNAAIPEALAGQVRPGQPVTVTLPAYPGEIFPGRLSTILPEAAADSRTLTARVELPNRNGRLRPGMYGEVRFSGGATPALLVPSEAVIRTGRRTLVMLAHDGGRFRPAEVRVGRESGGQTEVLAGLNEGEKVVASGQFLIDSEASLSGVQARPIATQSPAATAAPALYQSTGRIEQLKARSVTLSHEPVPALKWPAMTMAFTLADPRLARGFKVGDRVAFAFDQAGGVPTIRRMTKTGAAQ
ncbi:MAG: efflux RND transporter periplasmic adaptor subunit [Phenylobacterium sp.]|uniref:efflux RND transporter periplasmic adaptor subunit n=1 Tax=Phenylobacterium sp. TaxID=1871053 RepID=UPI0025D429F6|nr:efflux RND transporter periplasmic adaptor subunit [Phenylobacterium sp.]MBI1196233.1 efflux RND transporter periplasmic adaptor subunit [Phenylobacterium sp.]